MEPFNQEIVVYWSSVLKKRRKILKRWSTIKKPFDTVDHNILLRKLDYCGIRSIANEWFCSFLKKRKQFVRTENNKSCIKEILTKVPQGRDQCSWSTPLPHLQKWPTQNY